MLKIIDVYVAMGGGGQGVIMELLGVCSTKPIAQEIAKGKGEFGSDGMVCERKAVLDTESEKVYLLDRQAHMPVELNVKLKVQEERIRERAIQKLSDEELAVLGIKR